MRWCRLVTAAVPRHSLGPARPGAGAFLGVQWQSHCRGERTGGDKRQVQRENIVWRGA